MKTVVFIDLVVLYWILSHDYLFQYLYYTFTSSAFNISLNKTSLDIRKLLSIENKNGMNVNFNNTLERDFQISKHNLLIIFNAFIP